MMTEAFNFVRANATPIFQRVPVDKRGDPGADDSDKLRRRQVVLSETESLRRPIVVHGAHTGNLVFELRTSGPRVLCDCVTVCGVGCVTVGLRGCQCAGGATAAVGHVAITGVCTCGPSRRSTQRC